MSHQPDSPAFLKLPEELIVMIFDVVVAILPTRPSDRSNLRGHMISGTNCDEFRTLKNMRLACPQYAYLPQMLSMLFQSIPLLISWEDTKLQQIDQVPGIRPYIRHISFRNTSCWTQPSDHRAELLSLQTSLTECLRKLPDVHEIDFCSPNEFYTHRDPFTLALASLSAAGTVIKSFDLGHEEDAGDFAWARDGQLDGLSLSSLETLNFRPQGGIDCYNEHAFGDEHSREILYRRAGVALTGMLMRCSSTVRDVTFGDSCFISWPQPHMKPPALPKLQDLRVYDPAQLKFPEFNTFLLMCCPSLRRLELHGRQEDNALHWPQLWNAIRSYPRGIQVELHGLWCATRKELSLSHFTGEESRQSRHQVPFFDVQHSLAMCLSGLGGWDKILRIWFDQEDASDDDGQ